MVPLEFELPRHWSSSGYNEGLPKESTLTSYCNRVASPKMETRCLCCMNVIATFGKALLPHSWQAKGRDMAFHTKHERNVQR